MLHTSYGLRRKVRPVTEDRIVATKRYLNLLLARVVSLGLVVKIIS